MDILGLAGSPRTGANSTRLLDELLKGAQSAGAIAKKIVIPSLQIAGCRECHDCDKTGECSVKDDMQLIYPKLKSVKHIVVSSPIFYYGLSSQLKALIDRAQACYAKKYILKQKVAEIPSPRLGAFIAVAGSNGEKVFDGALLTVKYFFDSLDVKYYQSILVRNTNDAGDINKHHDQLDEAFHLGEELAGKL